MRYWPGLNDIPIKHSILNIVKRPSHASYDYIIIGSGYAGSTLAARLTENNSSSVLLIEAGPSDRNIFIQMPAGLGIPLMKDRYNWKFSGERNSSSPAENSVYTPRGRVLGGSSSINGMNWVRGNRADYDGWADAGLKNWSYAHCLPYFKRSENFDGGDRAYRGDSGPTKVVKAEITNPLFQSFLDASTEFGLQQNPDHNAASQSGAHATQRNVADGTRHSASQAYLYDRPQRENLEILLETRCTKIEFSGDKAVRIQLNRRGDKFALDVGNELIVSAGALQSPQLLMLSGLGDAEILKDSDIAVVQHMPGVGANLQDHVAWCFEFGATNPQDSLASKLGPLGRLKVGIEWLLAKRGLGISNHFEVGAFLCAGVNEVIPDTQLECIAMRGDFSPDGITIEPGYQCFTSLQRPTSRGRVWIENADPVAAPKFRFNYLGTDYDRATGIAAFRATQEIFKQPAWGGRVTSELSGSGDLNTDQAVLEWVDANAESNYHPCGTCGMGSDDNSVTDSEGKVHGFDNLRVVDASIIPSIPTGNLNAVTIMMAEKISDAILGLAPLAAEFPEVGHQ